MNSKNICFLIGNLDHSGGTERVTTLIANALVLKGYKVSILSLVGGNSPFFNLNPAIKVYSLYSQKISMKKNFISTVWKIRKFAVEKNVDTLIVVDSISCVFTVPALWGLKIKHICWEHFNFNVNLGVKFRDIGRSWAAKYCNYIITLTKRDKELWNKGLKKVKAKIIAISNPSPYDVQKHIPSLDTKTILCVGRLNYQKGFDLLIRSWAKVSNTIPEWKVIIVGTGEEEEKLKEMVQEYGLENSVVFAGQQKNMDSYYKQASFFCMSSRFEGLPMVLLEAQSYGLPIISFDCDTGPAELINNNNGYLVEKNNIDMLASAILEMTMLSFPRYNELVDNTFKNTVHFNLNNIIDLWENIL